MKYCEVMTYHHITKKRISWLVKKKNGVNLQYDEPAGDIIKSSPAHLYRNSCTDLP